MAKRWEPQTWQNNWQNVESLVLHLHCVDSLAPPTQKWLSTLSKGKCISYKSIILNHFSEAVWCIIHPIVELPIKVTREFAYLRMPLRADDWIILCLYSWDIDLSRQTRISNCAVEDFMGIYPDQSLKKEFSSSSKLYYIHHWTPPTWIMWKMTIKTKRDVLRCLRV